MILISGIFLPNLGERETFPSSQIHVLSGGFSPFHWIGFLTETDNAHTNIFSYQKRPQRPRNPVLIRKIGLPATISILFRSWRLSFQLCTLLAAITPRMFKNLSEWLWSRFISNSSDQLHLKIIKAHMSLSFRFLATGNPNQNFRPTHYSWKGKKKENY